MTAADQLLYSQDVPRDEDYRPQAKWKVQFDPNVVVNIQLQRDKWIKFLKQKNNTANKEVWSIYDHLTDDLMNECLTQSLGGIDASLNSYLEQVIVDEF
jgi:hypothetical protein